MRRNIVAEGVMLGFEGRFGGFVLKKVRAGVGVGVRCLLVFYIILFC